LTQNFCSSVSDPLVSFARRKATTKISNYKLLSTEEVQQGCETRPLA
jgi:hypothetical protein